jgi:phosphate/sulfate permease
MMLRRLLPNKTDFFDFFDRHIELTVQGCHELLELARSGGENIEARAARIKEIEHATDRITHECIEALHETFITPIERGDIHRLAVYWIFRNWRPQTVDKFFRKGQLISAALYSLGHGGNDAQKTMGIIVALLVAVGAFSPQKTLSLKDPVSLAIIFSCHLAMGIGTAIGGWRIVKTMGMRLTKLRPVGGFCAEVSGAATLFLATHLGIPVSTTHTITGAIVGVGATQKLSGVKWGVAGRIVWAWIQTIPCSGAVGALCFLALRPFIM